MAELTFDAIASALKSQEFDIAITDVIVARREDGGRAWEVVVDRGGQLKATITWHSRKPTAKSRKVLGRTMNVLTERLTVVTATALVQDHGDVVEVLAALAKSIAPRKTVQLPPPAVDVSP